MGQAERVLTGYDVLLLSVLVEAQAGTVATTTAAPCPLRGFTRATVVASTSDAGRLAAAGALVTAAAGLADKVGDGDLPRAARLPAQRVAARLDRAGTALAACVGLDPSAVRATPAASAALEGRPDVGLRPLLAPTGEAVASLFAHTSVVAGQPANVPALARAGRAFGALVHLLDAVEDHASDQASGRFNPLSATQTSADGARRLAQELVEEVRSALADARFAERTLVDVLLGGELDRAVQRVLPDRPTASVPAQRTSLPALLLAVLLSPAVFIGGSWGGGSGVRAGDAASAAPGRPTATHPRAHRSTATAGSDRPAVSSWPATAAPTSPATPAAAGTPARTADRLTARRPRGGLEAPAAGTG